MAAPNFTAGDVMSAARGLLNDTAGQYYTNTVQIPYLQMARSAASIQNAVVS